MASWHADRPYDQAQDAPHLFLVNGQPTLTRDDTRLLKHAVHLIKDLDRARGHLLDGIALDNPDTVAAAGRQLLAIGAFITDYANQAGR